MGILNVTPDSFSGDGLLAGDRSGRRPPSRQARRDGRRGRGPPRHRRRVDPARSRRRSTSRPRPPGSCPSSPPSAPPCRRRRSASTRPSPPSPRPPSTPAPTCSTTCGAPTRTTPLGRRRGRPRRADRASCTTGPRRATRTSWREVVADLRAAVDRAHRGRRAAGDVIVDPGIGFGKTAEHNLALLRDLGRLRGARPADPARHVPQVDHRDGARPARRRAARGTLATTALGIAAGVDIVRVHDVRANVRAARVSRRDRARDVADAASPDGAAMTDRIVLTNMRFEAATASTTGSARPPSRSRSTSSCASTCSRPASRDDLEPDRSTTGRSTRSSRPIVEAHGRSSCSRPSPRRIAHDAPGRLPRSTRSSSASASRPSSWAARSTTRRRDPPPARLRRDAGRPGGPDRRGAASGCDLEVGRRVPRVSWRVTVWPSRRTSSADGLARGVLAEGRVERVLVVDGHAVDPDDDVAVLETGLGGRRPGLDGRASCRSPPPIHAPSLDRQVLLGRRAGVVMVT